MKECEPVKARPVAFLGIDERTIQRWKLSKLREDCRKGPYPSQLLRFLKKNFRLFKSGNKLRILRQEPRQIVPELADRGVYPGSESTIYRLLKSEKLMKHRGKSRPPRKIEAVSTSSKLQGLRI